MKDVTVRSAPELAEDSETEAREAARIVLKKEVDLITESFLLERLPITELDLLQSQLWLETQSVLTDSAQLLAAEVKSLSTRRRAVSHRIKVFLVKSFSRILAVNLLEMGRMAYSDWLTLKDGRKDVLQSLLDTVNSLFATEGREAKSGIFPRLETVLNDKDVVFMRRFNHMFNTYVRGGHDLPGSPHNKARTLVLAVKWWLQTQADFHVDRVNAKLTQILIKEGGAGGGASRQASRPTSGPPSLRQKKRKFSLQQQKLRHGPLRKSCCRGHRRRPRAPPLRRRPGQSPRSPPDPSAPPPPEETSGLELQEGAASAAQDDARPPSGETGPAQDEAPESVSPSSQEDEETALGDAATAAQMEMRKNIRVLVKSIVSRTSKKLKFGSAVNDPQVMKWLFNKVWAEVKDIECQITPEMLKKLENSVVKHLCKKWGDAMTVLHLMDLEDSAINKYIASSYMDPARKSPRKRNAIYRFFFALRNAYRGRKKMVGV